MFGIEGLGVGYFEDRITNGGDGRLKDVLSEVVSYQPAAGGAPISATVVWVDEGSEEDFDRVGSVDLVTSASVEVQLSELTPAVGDRITRLGSGYVVVRPGAIAGGWQTLDVRLVAMQTIAGSRLRAQGS